jgi:transposase
MFTREREAKKIASSKAVVEAIVIRGEPVHLVARISNVVQWTLFDWLSLYRSGGWDSLKEVRRSGWPEKSFRQGNALVHRAKRGASGWVKVPAW